MIFDIAAHPLLDPADLSGTLLQELTELAEFVLGLRGSVAGDFDADETKDLRRALALQVSLMAAADPEAYLASRVDRAGEGVTYREGVILHPTAEAIVTEILAPPATDSTAGEYAVLKSLR
jgi:hypothetical protein